MTLREELRERFVLPEGFAPIDRLRFPWAYFARIIGNENNHADTLFHGTTFRLTDWPDWLDPLSNRLNRWAERASDLATQPARPRRRR